MSILLLIVGAACFFYIIARIGNLELRINKLEKGNRVLPPVAKPAAALRKTETAVTQSQPIQAPTTNNQKQPTPVAAPQTPAKPHSTEFQFGGQFFTIVGAVAVLLGVGFFFKFAIDQGLISETARIVLGFMAGIILLAAGELLRQKYNTYSQILQGTGIGVFYLTVFSAYNFYGMFGQGPTFILMVATTLLAVFLALRANSQHLAALAQVGAYLTPFMVGPMYTNVHELFVYLFIVNIGALILVLFKGWRGVTLGALAATAIHFVSWYLSGYNENQWSTAMVYLTLFFLTFLSANIYRYFVQKHVTDPNDLALVIFNPLFYFLVSYVILDDVNVEYAGWLAIILAVGYFALGVLIPDEGSDAKTFHFGVSSILFLVGVPIVLDKNWVSIAWAALGTMFLRYSLKRNFKELEYIAQIILMIATLRLLVYDLLQPATDQFIFNGRMLNFAIVVGLMLYGAYQVYKHNGQSKTLLGAPLPTDKGAEVLLIQAQALSLVWIWVELRQFEVDYAISVLWTLLAALIFYLGGHLKGMELRLMAYGSAAAAVINLLINNTEIDWFNHTLVFNSRFFAYAGTVVGLIILIKLINEFKEELEVGEYNLMSKSTFIVANLLGLWIISLEIMAYFDYRIKTSPPPFISGLINAKRVGLSIAWSLYAGTLLAMGIAWKSASARLFSIALFAVVIFKVFLFDTTSLPDFYRFVSFLSLGVVLLVTGFLYNRYKERIEEFLKAA